MKQTASPKIGGKLPETFSTKGKQIFPQSNLHEIEPAFTTKYKSDDEAYAYDYGKQRRRTQLAASIQESQKKLDTGLESQMIGYSKPKKSLSELEKIGLEEEHTSQDLEEESTSQDAVDKDVEEYLESNYQRRTTLHIKEDVTALKYSISPAWEKLVMNVQVRRSKRKKTRKERPIKEHKYPNGSHYLGEWSTLGMQGTGKYRFFYGRFHSQ